MSYRKPQIPAGVTELLYGPARRQAQRAVDKDLDTVIEVYTERISKLKQQLERHEPETAHDYEPQRTIEQAEQEV